MTNIIILYSYFLSIFPDDLVRITQPCIYTQLYINYTFIK